MQPVADRLSSAIKLLIIVQALLYAVYLLVPAAKVPIAEHLALGPAMIRGEFWQPVTALFVHLHGLTFFFDVIGLWFVGAALERELGLRRFLILFFVPAILGNIAYGLLAGYLGRIELTAGCGLGVLALFVVFGKLYGRTPARVLGGLVMEARWLAVLLVGFSLFVDVTQQAWPSLASSLVAIAMAYVLSGGRGGFIHDLLGRLRGGGIPGRKAGPSGKRKYGVIDGGRSKRGRNSSYLN